MFNYACRICNSEQREEIEEMLLQKAKYRDIAKKFLNLFDCGLHLLEQSVAKHNKHIVKYPVFQEHFLRDCLY